MGGDGCISSACLESETLDYELGDILQRFRNICIQLGRSILVDKNNIVIAGNGVFAEAKELGIKVRVIESDGKELIVVKRTDRSTEDEKRKLLALVDNTHQTYRNLTSLQ